MCGPYNTSRPFRHPEEGKAKFGKGRGKKIESGNWEKMLRWILGISHAGDMLILRQHGCLPPTNGITAQRRKFSITFYNGCQIFGVFAFEIGITINNY